MQSTALVVTRYTMNDNYNFKLSRHDYLTQQFPSDIRRGQELKLLLSNDEKSKNQKSMFNVLCISYNMRRLWPFQDRAAVVLSTRITSLHVTPNCDQCQENNNRSLHANQPPRQCWRHDVPIFEQPHS